jgi:hypothetical protein
LVALLPEALDFCLFPLGFIFTVSEIVLGD